MPDLIIGEHDANGFSLHEGQTLASIYNYTQITGEPPLEREIQDYFHLDAAAVHQLIETLEEIGFISRVPGQERSVRVLILPQMLPTLEAV
jgi:DNA-binding MarR family transcriptional regulator